SFERLLVYLNRIVLYSNRLGLRCFIQIQLRSIRMYFLLCFLFGYTLISIRINIRLRCFIRIHFFLFEQKLVLFEQRRDSA
ncbi:hypothetical protein GIB67_000542, partial [Kingdonia uniflora]